MKTAISIPDSVFKQVEQFARRWKWSRSRVFAVAVAEFLARRSPDAITEAMNKVCDELGSTIDPFVERAARRRLKETPW